jgi:pimeloyl-ACP methyl ester carboxylesterase
MATRLDFLEIVAAAALTGTPNSPAAASQGIDESGFVPIGGIEQWIAIQGSDVNNPALLYLHGGPAEAQSPFLNEFKPWERDYTVVNWDQRGSGKTFARNGTSTPDMTVGRMALDAVAVAQYALRRLQKKKIVLVGQSWGCVLGLNAAARRPDLFVAYVGTGQPVTWKLSLAAREAFARSQMEAAHDTAAINALDAVRSLPSTDSKRLSASSKWRWAPSDLQYLEIERAFLGPDPEKATGDAAAWMAGGDFSGSKLWPAITAFDARTVAPEGFQVPIFVIQGRDDHVVSFDAAKAFVESLRAPAKAFVPIDGGHFACFTDSTEFLAALNQCVRPFIKARKTDLG